MKALILMGSEHLHGNTAALSTPFQAELVRLGAEVAYMTLADKRIAPCRGCYACQQVTGAYGCPQQDDMYPVLTPLRRPI